MFNLFIYINLKKLFIRLFFSVFLIIINIGEIVKYLNYIKLVELIYFD